GSLPDQDSVACIQPSGCTVINQTKSPWPGCGIPSNEEVRLSATLQLQLIGKEPHSALQRYVELVAAVLKRDIISLGLLDATHSHSINSKAEVPFTPTARPYALCTWTLVPDSPEVLMIEDLTQDARFRDFELVTQPPYLRSYVGAPVVLANGQRVGVMCALGTEPRATNAAATRLLVNVAGLVAREIEAMAGPAYDLSLANKVHPSKQQGLMMLDTSQPGWQILHCDCDDERLHADYTAGRSFWDIFAVADVAQPEVLFEGTVAEGDAFKVKAAITDPSGFADSDAAPFELEFRPGDAALPSLYTPMGTQVGTPAWIPESVEDQVDVAKIWFVIITRSGGKNRAALIGTYVVSDADKHNGQAALSSSQQPAVVLGTPDYISRAGQVHKAYPRWDPHLEVALTRGLSHPNIVHALRHASFDSQNASLAVLHNVDFGSVDSWDSWGQEASETNGRHAVEVNQETWLMLEYCDKGSLLDAVDRGWLYTSTSSHFTGLTDLKKLLLTALELANALAYLHSVDVMHGDLTGGNVLLHSSPITPADPRGFIVKVADFGMSRIHTETKQTAAQGTITHMPPELIRHGRLHRARSEAHFQAASGTVDRHAVTLSELLKGSSHARHPIGEEVVGSPSTYANLILKGVIWGVNVGASVHAY
ncbi:MAG: mixed lineage kinase, partial [Trebouxia sp. A1-2]